MHVAANQIVKSDRTRLHLEANDVRRVLWGDRQRAAAAGVAIGDSSFFGSQALGIELLDCAVAAISAAAAHKFFGPFAIPAQAVALIDRPFVPVDPQPLQGADDLLGMMLPRALDVRIFNAQQHFAAMAAGMEQVENRGAGAADMQVAGRRGGEAELHCLTHYNRSAPCGSLAAFP